MDDNRLVQRVDTVFNRYKLLFGDTEHLNLSEDIAVAQKELQDLQSKEEKLTLRHSEQDTDVLRSAERLAAYDEFLVLEAAKKRKRKQDLSDLMMLDTSTTLDASNRTKSKLEIIAEERDYKRRRQSYKGGKASSMKRSYTEVIRDVIETQSEMLRSMIKAENPKS